MPGLDRRGPMGEGSMTGGGRGLCNTGRPLSTTGRPDMYGNAPWRGRGPRAYNDICMGMGRRGLGRRNISYPLTAQTEQTEIEILKSQANTARETLDRINRRIEEIEKKTG
ncbi:MAG: DUF5320 domain-containing protein [Desulfobacterales bacterium]|nr:DUF5320 domain-containing protein [Desulfobacterales bacterium]